MQRKRKTPGDPSQPPLQHPETDPNFALLEKIMEMMRPIAARTYLPFRLLPRSALRLPLACPSFRLPPPARACLLMSWHIIRADSGTCGASRHYSAVRHGDYRGGERRGEDEGGRQVRPQYAKSEGKRTVFERRDASQRD